MRAGRSRGFTLVEVLVAMLVMAIMAVMAWQGVDSIVRSRNASQARLEQALRLSTVIAQWDQDLASIDDTRAVPQAIKCDGASVRLIRRASTGLQVVTWTLRPDNSSGGNWVRWAGPAVTTTGELKESWLRSLQLQGGEPGSVTTLSGLAAWQVYYYLNNSWANCQSSGDVVGQTAPSPTAGAVTPRTALPNGVRVVLSFAPGSGLSGELTRDTQLGP